MRVGELRKQVAVQQERQTPDGAGGYALAWVTLATLWADISPVSGREIYTFGHLEGRMTHKVTMRWRGDLGVTPDMRLLCGDRVFNILAVMNIDERNQYAELLVEEGGAV